jgi:hypothetical protein
MAQWYSMSRIWIMRLFLVYITKVSITLIYSVELHDRYWIMNWKDVEGSGERPIWGISSHSFWGDENVKKTLGQNCQSSDQYLKPVHLLFEVRLLLLACMGYRTSSCIPILWVARMCVTTLKQPLLGMLIICRIYTIFRVVGIYGIWKYLLGYDDR